MKALSNHFKIKLPVFYAYVKVSSFKRKHEFVGVLKMEDDD